MSRILLGVSGSVAAYKSLEFVRLATAAGHAVRVIQTPAAQTFVGAASFAALTGGPVLTSESERDPARGAFPGQAPPQHDPLNHLELVANSDVLLIAPASANTIAKLAHGLADNLLCSAALVARCPLLLAPAMNNAMYEHPATQANLELLKSRGARVLEPGVGRLGSAGEWGVGRLAEPAEMLRACELAGGGGNLAGLKVLVTAGGTREPIDSVRFVGNRSSGRMGVALAEEASTRGAQVVVLAANVTLPRVPGVRYVDVRSALELQRACEAEFADADVLLMAAAVADFRPSDVPTGKISKSARESLDIRLEATTDILALLASRAAPHQTLVGFAAEHGEGALERARAKLERKSLHAVVVNDVSNSEIGFDSQENEVAIVTPAGETWVARTGKRQVAAAVLDAVEQMRLVLSSI